MKAILLKSNIVGATCNFLNECSIPHSTQYVEEYLKAHRDYPSLSSVSALLQDFNIENVPVMSLSEWLPCSSFLSRYKPIYRVNYAHLPPGKQG